jgi:hypothetical protein
MRTLTLCALLALTACGGGGEGTTSGGIPGYGITVAAEPDSGIPAVSDCSIRFEGDSILYGADGMGKRSIDPPAAILARLRPKFTIDDQSTPGESAARRMPVLINMSISSRLVVVQFGMNDAGNATAYEPAMRAILERMKALGKQAIVTGISRTSPDAAPLQHREAYDAIARKLAGEYGLPFADWGSVDLPAALMLDGVHPGIEGTQRLVVKLVGVLDAVAPECSK